MQLPAPFGKYELLEHLGGGMSHVFKARDTVIGRTVVVKILTDNANNDPQAKARFLQEARLAGNIQHDNIVRVYDFGEHQGRSFMVMEYLSGEDLRGAIKGNRTGTLMNRLRIARDVATALEYVNGLGVIHRDIKPENIHIDSTGKVKLMDFGIAKTANLALTRTGMAMGTPYYMAPEQVRGQTITNLVDVYAWGLLVYELLTGTRSVNAPTMEAVFYSILNVPLDVDALTKTGAPPAVRDLVARCADKDVAKRPQGFGPVIQELNAILAAEGPGSTQPAPQAQPQPAARSGTVATQARTAPTQPSTRSVPMAAEPPKRGLLFGILAAAAVIVVALVVMFSMGPSTPPAIAGMVYIPAGTFLAGADKHSVTLHGFYIDQTEVTNAQFEDFCLSKAQGAPADCNPWMGAPDLPAVNVTIVQARAFAKKYGKRLPTGLEWERAARGDKGAAFPWGDDPDPFKANVADNTALGPGHRLTSVKSLDASLMIHDMVGNAFEMVEGRVTPSEAAVAHFDASLVNPPATAQEPWAAMRGGSYNTPLKPDLVWDSVSFPERFKTVDLGFRCAKDAP